MIYRTFALKKMLVYKHRFIFGSFYALTLKVSLNSRVLDFVKTNTNKFLIF